jgi:hypothetical protein
MDRHRSLGVVYEEAQCWRRREERRLDHELGPQGSVVNYLGNPRFRPNSIFKRSYITEEMHQHCQYYTSHAIVITDEGPLAVSSHEEVKDIIQHSFGIRKHDFVVYRSNPEPFLALFHDPHDRDVVFAAGKALDGPIE